MLRYGLNHRCSGAIIKFRVESLRSEPAGRDAGPGGRRADEMRSGAHLCALRAHRIVQKLHAVVSGIDGLYRIMKNILPWGQGFLK